MKTPQKIMKCLNCGFVDSVCKEGDTHYTSPSCAKCHSGAYTLIEPSKPSEIKAVIQDEDGDTFEVGKEIENTIRADERAKIREELSDVEFHYFLDAQRFYKMQDIYDLLK